MPDEGADKPNQPEDAAPDATRDTDPAERDAADHAEAQANAEQTGGKPNKPAPLKPSGETKPKADKKSKRGKDKPEPTTAGGKLWHNWVKPIGVVVIIVVVLRSMLIDWNDVPTGSMEQEIQVGDRILVNRLAYGLQFPLTGPKIGIPFTPLQWDNPLDGIPQIQWGSGPDRGDIVTFWNPVTKVRMVKRIVAKPGDTISMNGGVMTIKHADGSETAAYTDLTSTPARQTKYMQPSQLGKPVAVYDDLEDLEETLLGETRKVQHIKKRWLIDAQIIEAANGNRLVVDQGYIKNGYERTESLQDVLKKNGNPHFDVLAEVKDGVTHLQGKPVSYNVFAEALLKRYTTDGTDKLLDKAGLEIDGHELILDGEAVPIEFFRVALKASSSSFSKAERAKLAQFENTLGILQTVMLTSFGPITLGEDDYYMVGDNRNNSSDSRYFGPVKRSEITGKAFAVAFSFKDNKILTLPPKPDWSRWFKDLD